MVSGLWIGWDVSGGKKQRLVPCFQATMAYELQSKHEKEVYKKKLMRQYCYYEPLGTVKYSNKTGASS